MEFIKYTLFSTLRIFRNSWQTFRQVWCLEAVCFHCDTHCVFSLLLLKLILDKPCNKSQSFMSSRTALASRYWAKLRGGYKKKIFITPDRTSDDIVMKLGPVTKLDKRSKTTSKKWRCDVIAIFPIYGQFGTIRKPDSGRMAC